MRHFVSTFNFKSPLFAGAHSSISGRHPYLSYLATLALLELTVQRNICSSKELSECTFTPMAPTWKAKILKQVPQCDFEGLSSKSA